ncbi:uncharacterized protein BYT42DRAFT_569526 [Radiomyces spectabilis]|uniref:uncharacterized protein n=1 Tax=Radiomyces spectabilis TaxID=64574 RepID=UPI00221F1D0B|nr:uncharacterized protein BYT42DRAFT_569526 [Radiomyces spectabilis]KAI8379651.1 hypothetical protein BYT42DRAFT_569526 [Radiomyces spectabilis]
MYNQPPVAPWDIPATVNPPPAYNRRRSSSFDMSMFRAPYNGSLKPPAIPTSVYEENPALSYSPLSTTSTDSNLISPPQTFLFPDLYDDAVMYTSSSNTAKRRRRSSSVPPTFRSFMDAKNISNVEARHQPYYPLANATPQLTFAQLQVTDPTPRSNRRNQPPAPPVPIERINRPAPSKKPATLNQAEMDEQLLKANFDDITVTELKEMLRQRGLPVNGKKATLIERLQNARQVLLNMHSINHNVARMSISTPPNQEAILPTQDSGGFDMNEFFEFDPPGNSKMNAMESDIPNGLPSPKQDDPPLSFTADNVTWDPNMLEAFLKNL